MISNCVKPLVILAITTATLIMSGGVQGSSDVEVIASSLQASFLSARPQPVGMVRDPSLPNSPDQPAVTEAGCGLVGDIQPTGGDGVVDLNDITRIGTAWRAEPGDLNWCDMCDLDLNNKINVQDIMLAVLHFGEACIVHPFGVDMTTTGLTDGGGLSMAQGAGVNWARMAVGWSFVEGDGTLPPGSPTYNWSGYDSQFLNAKNAGVTPIVIVGYPVPVNYRASGAWASANCGLLSAAGLARFHDFLVEAAERYDGDGFLDAPGSPVVEYWELGNEPDKSGPPSGVHFGLCYGNNGDEYAELLKTAWDALHSDPDREVYLVFGGMAYEDCCGFNSDPMDRTAGPDFLDTVLDYIQNHPLPAGTKYFDTMNYHGYHWFVCNSSFDYDPPTILGKASIVRSKLASHGLDKPLMLTEAGWWTNGGSECGVPNSLERQSRYVVQVFVRSMAGGIVSTIWHSLADFSYGAYGVVEIDLDPKPAYWAFKTMSDELAGYGYSRALTIGETGSSDIEGHVFTDGSGGEKWVLWTRVASTDITRSMSLPFESIRVVQKEKYSAAFPSGGGDPAAVTIIDDGGPEDLDGAVNGQIRINITASPIYVAPQ